MLTGRRTGIVISTHTWQNGHEVMARWGFMPRHEGLGEISHTFLIRKVICRPKGFSVVLRASDIHSLNKPPEFSILEKISLMAILSVFPSVLLGAAKLCTQTIHLEAVISVSGIQPTTMHEFHWSFSQTSSKLSELLLGRHSNCPYAQKVPTADSLVR